MTDLHAEALDRIPGLAALDRELANARALITRTREPNLAVDREALRTEALDAVFLGRELPADYGARVLAVERDQPAQHAATMNTLYAIRDELKMERERLLTEGADLALDYLREQLPLILDHARDAIAALGTVATAEEVLAASPHVVDAWRSLAAATQRYTALRQAQRAIVTADTSFSSVPASAYLRVAGEFEHLNLVWPGWRGARRDVDPERGELVRAADIPPWPKDADPMRGVYSTAYLRWLVTAEVGVWVPGIEEMRAAFDSMNTELDAAEYAAARNHGPDDATVYAHAEPYELHW